MIKISKGTQLYKVYEKHDYNNNWNRNIRNLHKFYRELPLAKTMSYPGNRVYKVQEKYNSIVLEQTQQIFMDGQTYRWSSLQSYIKVNKYDN